MIVFDLQCTCGCQFEGWFQSRADYERQSCDGLIGCPRCAGTVTHKILSPVAIRSGQSSGNVPDRPADYPEITEEKAIHFLRSIQHYVEQNFEDVGPRLAQESLKIHYGVIAPRNIRGVATEDEEKMLLEEGIELLRIPLIKKSTDHEPN